MASICKQKWEKKPNNFSLVLRVRATHEGSKCSALYSPEKDHRQKYPMEWKSFCLSLALRRIRIRTYLWSRKTVLSGRVFWTLCRNQCNDDNQDKKSFVVKHFSQREYKLQWTESCPSTAQQTLFLVWQQPNIAAMLLSSLTGRAEILLPQVLYQTACLQPTKEIFTGLMQSDFIHLIINSGGAASWITLVRSGG